MLAFAAASLVALYLWSYGDCRGAFFLNDDYREMRVANDIVIDSPLALGQFFRPQPFFLLYRPVTTVMYFYALRELFGHDPTRYHAVQLTIHVLNAILVYGIATRLFRAPAAGLAAALIYATAPGHAIATFWMVVITMAGTAFFYFLALSAWISVADARCRIALTYLLFGTALLASEHAITLPIALTLASAVLPERPDWRRIGREQCGLYVIAASYAAAKLYYIHYVMPRTFSPIEYALIQSHYGMVFAPGSVLRNVGHYLGYALSVAYAPDIGERTALLLGSVIVGAAVTSTAVVLLRRPTDATVRTGAFGLMLFVVALGPVAVLRAHAPPYYVGIAALGMALAIVAGARALPRTATVGPVLVALLFVGVHLTSTATRVRDGQDFKIFDGFSEKSARWLYTIATATKGRTPVEVVIPDDALEPVALANDVHKVLLCAPYTLRTSKSPYAEAPAPGRIVLRNALPLPQPRGFGRDWNWMVSACRSGTE